MAERRSRREVIKMGAVSAVALAIPAAAGASSLPSTEDVEAGLGHPMPEEARKLLKAALEANAKNGTDRLKHKLDDCSEPCFTYIVTGVEK